jgi:hypothetical protein
MDYHRLSAPGIMTLAAFVPQAGSTASPQDGVFAVMLRDGRSNPRIFAVRGRESLLGQMQQAARKKLAVSIIGKRVLLVLLLKWVSARFVCVCWGGGRQMQQAARSDCRMVCLL